MSYVSKKEFKIFVMLFSVLFFMLLIGVKIDSNTESVKYVMNLPDSLVREQLQNYFSDQEYHFSSVGDSFEVFPLQRNDQEFSKQLIIFKDKFVDTSLKINQLWEKSKTINLVKKIECSDVVKCSINEALRVSKNIDYDKAYQAVFNELKNKKEFGELVNSNWTSWAMVDLEKLDSSFGLITKSVYM